VFGGGQRVLEIVPWSLAQIPHREQSEQLAAIVADALANRVPLSARPVDRAPLRVLESANMPAVLVEVGYLTNADQERAIAASELQAAVAQALVDAIVRFRDRVETAGTTR
jgi:N-acetylmuramoyl-L-alanine amidase